MAVEGNVDPTQAQHGAHAVVQRAHSDGGVGRRTILQEADAAHHVLLIALEEPAPFRRQQGAVGLNTAGVKLIVAQGEL